VGWEIQRLLPADDYWYRLKLDDSTPEITGHFTLKDKVIKTSFFLSKKHNPVGFTKSLSETSIIKTFSSVCDM
jgi:hypothetical protein